jgi:N-acyl homoserine lactone hydrolase
VHAAPGVDFLLTADACYRRAQLDREIIPGAGAAWNPDLMIETFARLRTLQDRQGCHRIFGHDPEQWATVRHAPVPLH